MRDFIFRCLAAGVLTLWPCAGADADWIRPKKSGDPLNWGRTEGMVFGLPSPGGMRGPRGLIRVGIWNANTKQAELVNFIAVEPVVTGTGPRRSRMAFSELEKGADGKQGKVFTTASTAGKLEQLSTSPRIERLSVRIDVEPFTANGAHVYVNASIRSDRPEELLLSVHHFEDSKPIEELTLTATMGNYERLRWLWLKGKVVDSRELYAGYSESGFIDKDNYDRDQILTTVDGDAIALATSNEADPTQAVVAERPSWTYKSPKLTQYWRVPKAHIQPDLRVKVNGRFTYWQSTTQLPGGVAFENFEMRQPYVPGQESIFGLTKREPGEIRPEIPNLGAPPSR